MKLNTITRAATLLALASTSFAQKAISSTAALSSTGGSSSRGSAPEIDVSLMGAALALVIGGVLVLTAMRRRKLARS